MTDEEVREKLALAVARAGGLRKWARLHKLSSSNVSMTLSGYRAPSLSILAKLGLQRVVSYELDPRAGIIR